MKTRGLISIHQNSISLASALKRIRVISKELGLKCEKYSGRTNSYTLFREKFPDRKLYVSVETICHHAESKCYLHSIKVGIYDAKPVEVGIHTRFNPSAIFRTRTISRRDNGSLNWDSVANAITKAFTTLDEFIERKKEEQKQNEFEKKQREKIISELQKEFKEVTERKTRLGFNMTDGSSARFAGVLDQKENQNLTPMQRARFYADFENLSIAELRLLVTTLDKYRNKKK